MYNCTKHGVVLKIVIDTSVIISVVTNEVHKSLLIDMTKNAELIAPSSLHWEIGNAFSAMLKRGRIDIENAQIAIIEYGRIPIQFYEVDIFNALEIANQLNIYAYDAYFIECSKKLNLPLLALDNQLIQKANEFGIKIIEV